MRGWAGAALAASVLGLTLGLPVLALSSTPQRLGTSFAAYPRVIRLTHGPRAGTLLATFDGGQNNYPLFESRDEGRTWTASAQIVETRRGGGSCCAALFELPRDIGENRAGTLLFAAAFGKDTGRMALEVWRSPDGGRAWSPYSTAFEAPGGLWEPQFVLAQGGRLALYFADETQDGRGQVIARVVSRDGGRTWGLRANVITGRSGTDRPGMPVVATTPNGFVMAYELCGRPGALDCAVFLKTSRDGLTWGDPAGEGELVRSEGGRTLRSAPFLAWAPGEGDGTLVLAAQMLYDADGREAPGNSRTLLVRPASSCGSWREVPAPVAVPAFVHWCPNYSSALLPSQDGRRVLEIATDWQNGTCVAYVAAGSLTPGGSP